MPRSSRSLPSSPTAFATAPSATPRATWSASRSCADKPDNPDQTHDLRSDHDRLFHPGNQDRAASRFRPGDGQGAVRRPARRTAADRRVLLRRLRGRRPAHRAGAGRWTGEHDLTGGLLASAGPRGEAGRGERRGCHRERARARRRWRPPGGHRHRPRWQRPPSLFTTDEYRPPLPRSASHGDTMSMATRTDTQSPALHVADSHDLIRVQGTRENNLKDVSVEIPKRRLTVFTGVSGSGKSSLVFGTIAAESQ